MTVLDRIFVIHTLAAINSNAEPATKKQVRRLNIIMSELMPQNRSGKLKVISYIVGRNLSTTKDLNRKEVDLIITETDLAEIVEYALRQTQ